MSFTLQDILVHGARRHACQVCSATRRSSMASPLKSLKAWTRNSALWAIAFIIMDLGSRNSSCKSWQMSTTSPDCSRCRTRSVALRRSASGRLQQVLLISETSTHPGKEKVVKAVLCSVQLFCLLSRTLWACSITHAVVPGCFWQTDSYLM